MQEIIEILMHYLHFKVMADALSKYLINVIYNFGTNKFSE